MAKIRRYSVEAKADGRFGVAVRAGERTLVVDQPLVAGGADAGATPMDHLFAALAGCIATTARIIAKQQKMVLNGMDIKIAGSLDLDVLGGKSTEGRPGVAGIEVDLTLDADLSESERQRFVQELRRRCPVADTLAQGAPLTIVAA
ncbi:MAG: OsmC family protein [Desulfuromonadales bacterium]